MKNSWIILCAMFILTACNSVKKVSREKVTERVYPIQSKSGSEVEGKIILTQEKEKVRLNVSVRGLPLGIHAMHLHEKADCSSPDGNSAGGHWNPTTENHGKWGHGEFHKGDISNMMVDGNGKAELSFATTAWCIGCKDDRRDILGKALVIHEKADDFKTQPTGNAGKRVGCAEIK
ncbi:MAG: superoxide dismutase family protein [Bergeyella sp.]|nr:superoxide dismutase family protein [Bergeyella sp.]